MVAGIVTASGREGDLRSSLVGATKESVNKRPRIDWRLKLKEALQSEQSIKCIVALPSRKSEKVEYP